MSNKKDFFLEKLEAYKIKLLEDTTLPKGNTSSQNIDQLDTITNSIKSIEKSSKKNALNMDLLVEQHLQQITEKDNAILSLEHEVSELMNQLIEFIDHVDYFGADIKVLNNTNTMNGYRLLLKFIIGRVAELGLQFFPEIGEKFDPAIHECVDKKHFNEYEVSAVVEIERRGYRYKGRLMRTAKVVINI